MYLNDDFAARRDTHDEPLLDRLFGECAQSEPKRSSCGCDGCGRGAQGDSFGLSGYPLAMVYSTLQDFEELYDKEMSLTRGTIFKGLDLPFLGGSSGSCGSQCSVCGGGKND